MFREKLKFSSEVNDKNLPIRELLTFSAQSPQAVETRIKEYEKVFGNQEHVKRVKAQFSDYRENELLASQYYTASVLGLAKTFAGYIAMERALDVPEGLFYYYDLLDIQGNDVLKNVGLDSIGNFGNKIITKIPLVTGTDTYSIALLKKLFPGHVKIEVIDGVSGAVQSTLTDNSTGDLTGVGGVLGTGSDVNYNTGAIEVVLATGFATTGLQLQVTAIHNQGGEANVNRFKNKLRNYSMNAMPEVLIGESDLISLASAEKVLGIDPQLQVIGQIQDLYTKMVNKQFTQMLMNGYTGSTTSVTIPNTYSDYRSKLDHFTSELAEAETQLGYKSGKGVNVTCWMTGKKGLNFMKKSKSIGLFKAAPQDYINDLVGFFDGVPVIHHSDIPENDMYGIHMTKGGELAPLGRGIFLPITNTPVIGNYENPVQQAQGVFYQHEVKLLVPELVQKVNINIIP